MLPMIIWVVIVLGLVLWAVVDTVRARRAKEFARKMREANEARRVSRDAMRSVINDDLAHSRQIRPVVLLCKVVAPGASNLPASMTLAPRDVLQLTATYVDEGGENLLGKWEGRFEAAKHIRIEFDYMEVKDPGDDGTGQPIFKELSVERSGIG